MKLLWISLIAGSLSAQSIEFNRDVRPILSDKCFLCHGADAKAKKIPLRLDVEAEAKADLNGRKAIVEGDPETSELIRRITSESKAKRMPPVYTGHSLTPKEIDTLRQWIASGAKWQKHWAFIPPQKAAVPAGTNAIDYFVREKLKQEGLQPSPAASREALLRRATFDLTGLPPTPQEIDVFLSDRSPQAYERAVDRLLASPRFGERMAARWLDVARYADSNGYQYDGERVMWRWRDYVIDSFNQNKPYDKFITEQLAGDLIPQASMEQKIATGFNRNHRINTEDGIIPEEYAVEYVVDRVETTSAAFMGLTMGCARCHNHKYDPISQKEFFQFYAYFNNVPEMGRGMKYGNSNPVTPAPTQNQQRELASLNQQIQKLEGKLAKISGKAVADSYRPTIALDYEQEFIANEPRVAGWAGIWDINDRFTLSARIYSEKTPDGPILTRMIDNPSGKGFGIHADQGKVHFHITSIYADDAIRMESEVILQPNQWYTVTATYDGSKMAQGVQVYVNGKAVQTKILLDTLYRPFVNAGSQFPQPLRIGMGWGPERRFNGKIDQARAWARTLEPEKIDAMAGSGDRTKVARWAFEDSTETGKQLNDLRWKREKLESSFPTVMVMSERSPRRDTFILTRGEYDKPSDKVDPGVPASLPALPQNAPNSRLTLAQWMVNRDHPLTARVTVNRFWQSLFGVGLVKTTEDFGQQGEWPSHPVLLDWLSVEFMEKGWNTKALLKTVLMSDTYQQSSKVTPELQQRDPENRLLARGPRVRLAAEMLRDQALLASGLIVEKLGGPSVRPYQPDGLWKEITMQSGEYEPGKGEDLYRRSLYTYWRRTVAPPMMLNFDSATRESCTVRENRTNTPLQALNLMNDETFLEASRVLGSRMMKEGLEKGFERVLSRRPRPQELVILKDSLAYHRDYFSDESTARKFIQQGESPIDPALNIRELAAYTSVASLIFNLDEAVTKP